jgi:hypothetical protein
MPETIAEEGSGQAQRRQKHAEHCRERQGSGTDRRSETTSAEGSYSDCADKSKRKSSAKNTDMAASTLIASVDFAIYQHGGASAGSSGSQPKEWVARASRMQHDDVIGGSTCTYSREILLRHYAHRLTCNTDRIQHV